MVKQVLPALAFIVVLSSCSTFKPLNFTSNKQVASVPPPATPTKFIEDISVTPQAATEKDIWTAAKENAEKKEANPEPKAANRGLSVEKTTPSIVDYREEEKPRDNTLGNRIAEVETASPVQFKYAILLNTEVESLPNKVLLEAVDEWYGVRYRTGGNGKTGVDCSGFTMAVYAAAYGLMIPRISREQYRTSRKISTTELQEGDLVFFSTNGRGVSHVGIYLGNNKFIHASVSRGVMVNDLFETYYLKRFVGAGRVDNKEIVTSN